ncbi:MULTISPECIES: alpha/beta hydrolase [unclassified Pseudonocardia]|uniref:alpha/beta fold hydrolase n=1 Tax=unclassified Pseudonocardia TaxID=2619320 RepID=UPI0003021AE1|nr:alpha/beta hydrolase [Pseudonocardia sp. Ae707_Ps1]OLM21099.1 putative hydrolase [Pseudonocardia sp. Ae707_Ps1]
MTIAVTTDLLDRPGARIAFDVRGSGPLLALVGSPMGADGFAALADRMAADHTVLTLDQRGTGRSTAEDPGADSPVPLRAADLAALVEHVGRGPATLLGSSGGAVVSLALAQERPDLVTAVVAHEPPLEELLPDVEARRASTERTVRAYTEQGPAAAWALFLAAVGLPAGPPEDRPGGGTGLPTADAAAPDPDRTAADERHFFLHEMRETVRWAPDLDVLRGRRVAVGIGLTSDGQLCDLTSRALAAGLGSDPERFPGGHVGFMEDPGGFETRLREVLAAL